MTGLSAVIITKNEERNIGRCLQSLKDVADEIVVVDSGSTDRTKDICKEENVRFHFHEWEGYKEQKNFANSLAKHPLILSIDADEALSDDLRASILEVKENPQADGYEVNRLTNYCGKWIHYSGWYPDRKLRLFNRNKFKWGGEKIHEVVIPLEKDNKTSRLQGDLLHYSYYTISEHISQANHFTDLTAELAVEKGKKSSLIKILFSPVFKFMRDYIFKLGFLDGYYGYIICRISAQATFLKYSKIRQIRTGHKN
jgi:glycosyltransferase involved in cell wall biosynthesis